jgi:hypothetical protein
MNFATKLAQTRVYTTTNQGGVDSQEVYNEGILQALDEINADIPSLFSENLAQAQIVTTSGTITGAAFFSISLITSNDFVGTILGVTIAANTTINLTAESGATFTEILYTITTGTITILTLTRI